MPKLRWIFLAGVLIALSACNLPQASPPPPSSTPGPSPTPTHSPTPTLTPTPLPPPTSSLPLHDSLPISLPDKGRQALSGFRYREREDRDAQSDRRSCLGEVRRAVERPWDRSRAEQPSREAAQPARRQARGDAEQIGRAHV
mgnify:CR=1 FL=1